MKILPNWWQRKFLRFEFLLACLLALVFILWVATCARTGSDGFLTTAERSSLYGILATLFGSLLGFAITAFSIMIGLAGSAALALLRDSGHDQTLVQILSSAIRSLGFGTLAALFAFLVNDGPWLVSVGALAGVALAFFVSFFRVARIAWVLIKIARRVFELARRNERRPATSGRPHDANTVG